MARASGIPERTLIRELAGSLAAVADDHPTLVMACRQMVADHPGSGGTVWLCARMLTSMDPRSEAWSVAGEIERDPTDEVLADALFDGADVVVVGCGEQIAPALGRRADVHTRLVDVDGNAAWLGRQLAAIGCSMTEVPVWGAGAAVASADLVVIEATAVGPTAALVVAGAAPIAAFARHGGVPVWLVTGAGRVLPGPMWDGLVRRQPTVDAWDRDDEELPLDLVDLVLGPGGSASVASTVQRPSCPYAPELT